MRISSEKWIDFIGLVGLNLSFLFLIVITLYLVAMLIGLVPYERC